MDINSECIVVEYCMARFQIRRNIITRTFLSGLTDNYKAFERIFVWTQPFSLKYSAKISGLTQWQQLELNHISLAYPAII
jgi:hypothetical protein